MASASKYPTVQAVKTLHKTGEWADYFKNGDAATIEKDYKQVSFASITALADAIAAVKAATIILNNATDNIWRQDLREKLRSAPKNRLKKKKNRTRVARLAFSWNHAHSFSLCGRPSADINKVEEELAKGKRSVRKQIEKAKAFVNKFSSDLEIRRTAADASPELIAMWDELKHAYQAENNAGEKLQDCLDKYPKTSELIQQTKQSMDAKVNFPALFERLIMVTKLDSERKELQKGANDAKAARLAAEKKLTSMGITLDPSSAYIPAPSSMPATPSRVPDCY